MGEDGDDVHPDPAGEHDAALARGSSRGASTMVITPRKPRTVAVREAPVSVRLSW